MALPTTLVIDETLPNNFVLGTTDTYITTGGGRNTQQGNLPNFNGALDYYSWLTGLGINPVEIGGGTQSPETMASFVIRLDAPGAGNKPNEGFEYYANGVQNPAGTAKLQQPIRWDSLVHSPNDVVWGVYFPQVDAQPIAGVGKIQAFGTVVDDAASVGSDNPDSNDAKQALADLLAKFGTRYAGTFNGPIFTGNPTQDIFGAQGIIAMGCFITYSNIHGTWLCYAST